MYTEIHTDLYRMIYAWKSYQQFYYQPSTSACLFLFPPLLAHIPSSLLSQASHDGYDLRFVWFGKLPCELRASGIGSASLNLEGSL
jgi:hypothetical protein